MFERIYYTVQDIRGDYAILLDQNGIENTVAMALLPPGVDVGDALIYEMLSYRIQQP